MTDVIVPPTELTAEPSAARTGWRATPPSSTAGLPGRTARRTTPSSAPGVSQNPNQFVNLTEQHGYNLGAAGMPNGVNNNLHLHFTAEVFINFGGTFRPPLGGGRQAGRVRISDGDIISVPSWIFRGFTNEGPDDGLLLTVLGSRRTGGIIWGPSVLTEAESYGLYLTADNRLIDTVAGDELPADVSLDQADAQRYIDELTPTAWRRCGRGSPSRGTGSLQPASMLCRELPGGAAELALVIGYGMSEDRRAVPVARAAQLQHGLAASHPR